MAETTMDAAQLLQSPVAQKWAEGLRHHSDVGLHPDDERRQLLAGFCEYLETTPEELVARCFRIRKKDGMRAISSKNRKQISDAIEEYVASQGLTGYDQIKAANTLRSLLIHSAVLILGPAHRGR